MGRWGGRDSPYTAKDGGPGSGPQSGSSSKPKLHEHMRERFGPDWTVTQSKNEKYKNPIKRKDYEAAKADYIKKHGNPY